MNERKKEKKKNEMRKGGGGEKNVCQWFQTLKKSTLL